MSSLSAFLIVLSILIFGFVMIKNGIKNHNSIQPAVGFSLLLNTFIYGCYLLLNSPKEFTAQPGVSMVMMGTTFAMFACFGWAVFTQKLKSS